MLIITQNGFWPNLDFPHRITREESMSDPTVSLSKDKLYSSFNFLFVELKLVLNFNFDQDYRRKSNSINVKISDDLKVKAFITKDNQITLSTGLLLAIEDACQSICSDSRCKFAVDKEDTDKNGNIHVPWVFWANGAKLELLLDSLRFVDYNVANNYREIVGDYPVGAYHKFVSASLFRQHTADLISNIAFIWILAHEDAHNYLGHTKYFLDDMSGLPNQDMAFFEEFAIDPNTKDKKLSAEIYADMHASWVVSDIFYYDEVYEAYPFLNNWAQLCDLNKSNVQAQLKEIGIDPKEHRKLIKSGHLIRLLVAAQAISICIFERNTIKSNSVNLFHPTLATRILNIIETTVGRTITVANNHNTSNLLPLTLSYTEMIFQLIAKDLEVIFLYMFQMGFAIKDFSIELKSIQEVLEFEVNEKRLVDFALCLTELSLLNLMRNNWQVLDKNLDKNKLERMITKILEKRFEDDKRLSQIDEKIITHLNNHAKLIDLGNSEFLKSRLSVQSHLHKKVHNDFEKRKTFAENINFFLNFYKKISKPIK